MVVRAHGVRVARVRFSASRLLEYEFGEYGPESLPAGRDSRVSDVNFYPVF